MMRPQPIATALMALTAPSSRALGDRAQYRDSSIPLVEYSRQVAYRTTLQ
jgi:hypothetical protein